MALRFCIPIGVVLFLRNKHDIAIPKHILIMKESDCDTTHPHTYLRHIEVKRSTFTKKCLFTYFNPLYYAIFALISLQSFNIYQSKGLLNEITKSLLSPDIVKKLDEYKMLCNLFVKNTSAFFFKTPITVNF